MMAYNLPRSTASEQLRGCAIESGYDAVMTLLQARVALHAALIVHIPQLETLARTAHDEQSVRGHLCGVSVVLFMNGSVSQIRQYHVSHIPRAE